MMPLVFHCHPGLGPVISAAALVAADDFSARYDLDRHAGTFSRPAHQLFGERYVGRVLVLRTAKGGVASAWMLREMMQRSMAPAALIFNNVNPILAQGAAFAGLPLVDRFEAGDVTKLFRTGDDLLIEPAVGRVTVRNRSSQGS